MIAYRIQGQRLGELGRDMPTACWRQDALVPLQQGKSAQSAVAGSGSFENIEQSQLREASRTIKRRQAGDTLSLLRLPSRQLDLGEHVRKPSFCGARLHHQPHRRDRRLMFEGATSLNPEPLGE
jgi:hypothetical protein